MLSELNTLEPELEQKRMSEHLSDTLKGTLFGPPYTTGKIHQGTAAAMIAKDFYIRYLKHKKINQYKNFPYALDTQGLPIERKVEQEFLQNNISRKEVSAERWVQNCLYYSDKNIPTLKEQVSKLGLLNDVYKTPWVKTNQIGFKVKQMNFFADLYNNNYVHKDHKFVNYCLHCDTSLANAELELSTKKTKPVYLCSVPLIQESIKPLELVFATTCINTITNNRALLIADKNYHIFQNKEKFLIVGDPTVIAALPESGFEFKRYISAKDLIKYSYKMSNCERPIYISNTVKHEKNQNGDLNILTATACVHISPWDSAVDYEFFKSYNLLSDEFIWANCESALTRKKDLNLIKELINAHVLIKSNITNNQYEIYECWRCKNVIDETLTKQWFIKVPLAIKEELIKQVSNLKTNNMGYKQKFITWCSKKDTAWCISRSRHYGTPLPYLFCKNQDCKNYNIYEAYYFNQNDFKEKKQCYYYNMPAVISKKGLKCKSCQNFLSVDPFCLDVWTDPAFLPYYLNDNPSYEFLIEGQDQNRGFFYVTAVLSMLKQNKLVYNGLVYTPWFITAQKKKISKSEAGGENFNSLLERVGLRNFRSYCISKTNGEPTVFDENHVLMQKKYVNIILNIKTFLDQKEYAAIALKPLEESVNLIKDKDPQLKELIDELWALDDKLAYYIRIGHFQKYWLHLREFILHQYSRMMINNYKVKARTDPLYAHLLKSTGLFLLELCVPVLGDL